MRKLARQIRVTCEDSYDGTHRTYRVRGALFFVAADNFLNGIDFDTRISNVTLDLSGSTLLDSSAISAIYKVVTRLRRNGIKVTVVAPEGEDGALLSRLAIYDKPGSGQPVH